MIPRRRASWARRQPDSPSRGGIELRYRAEIDGLRAVAVLPVVLFHAGVSQFSGGFVGVDIFFVISGYLITRILIDDLNGGRFSLTGFYERRVRRILPAMLVVVVTCIPAAWVWLPPSDMQRFSDSLVGVATFSSNFLFWRQSGYFDTAAELKPLIHTWSLAVEEQFYIVFPAFLMLAYRFGKHVIVPLLVFLFIISLGFAVVFVHFKPSAAFFLLPTRGWELLLGALCTLQERREAPVESPFHGVLAAAGLAMIGLAVFAFDRSTPTPGLHTLLPTLGTALVLCCARQDTAVGAFLATRPLVRIGLVSYSTYLWHQPLLAFFRHANPEVSSHRFGWLAVPLSLCLGYLTWRYVEQPCRDKRRFSLRSIALLGAGGSLLVGVVGVAGHVSEGFRQFRSSNPVFVRDAAIQTARLERQRLIRAGTCHYDENLPIEVFIARWRCRSDDENLRDSRIVVFGDSHGADKVVALRLNGVDVWQITGAGCQVAPDFVKADRTHCGELFRLFESQKHNAKGILVANRFAEHELTEDYVQSVLRYWGGTGLPVLLFAPMPEFSQQQMEYASRGITTKPPSFEREARFMALLQGRPLPPNIVVLKASDLWCPDKTCVVASNEEYLMTDEDHLSRKGAELFGKALLGHKLFRTHLLP